MDSEQRVFLLATCIMFVGWVIVLEIIPPIPLGWVELVMCATILGIATPMAFLLIVGWPLMMSMSIKNTWRSK